MGKYRSNVFYGNSVKRKQKMEDKKNYPRNNTTKFPRAKDLDLHWVFTANLRLPVTKESSIPGGKSWS